VDSEGNAFDFIKAINANITITVKRRSPFFKYQTNEVADNLIITMYGEETYDDTETTFQISDAPVLSLLSNIIHDKDGDGVAEGYTV